MQVEAAGTYPRVAINVTPLIDVLLVLLIIFMVIQPSAALGLHAAAVSNDADNRHVEPDPRTLVLEVNASPSGAIRYRLNGRDLTGSNIREELQQVLGRVPNSLIFLQGDASLDFAAVASSIDLLHQAGAAEVAILTPTLMHRG